MDEFNFRDDLSLKKWVLGIASVLLALYLIGSFFEEGMIRAASNYILYGTKEDRARVDRVAREYQEEFDRIQNGMRAISEDIKKGADSINKDNERMQREFQADRKRLAEWDKSFDQRAKEMDDAFMKSVHETDAQNKRDQEVFLASWGKEEKAREKAREKAELKRLMALYKPSIECEKRVFGSSSFHPDDPYWYGETGIEYKFEQCKDLRRKKSP